MEFSLNVFTEFSDKNICHYSKRARTCHPATSCARNQDTTTRHIWETGSLNWAQLMLQWFIRFPEFAEFLSHLEKTPIWILHLKDKTRATFNASTTPSETHVSFLCSAHCELYSELPTLIHQIYNFRVSHMIKNICPKHRYITS